MANHPRTIDRYELVRKISDGASGIVYLARRDNQEFALKHLKTTDAAAVVRFRREAATLARINHPNLVKIYDGGELENAPYIVMDYVEGDTLAKVIRANHAGLQESEALRVTKAVAEALAEIHKYNLIHRDVKPANIIVSDKIVKLIDLGLVGDIAEIEKETALVGTPVYCSPEQTRVLKRRVDVRSDLYSLGVTLFECFTGRAPFLGSLTEILNQHSTKVAPSAREFNASLRPSLDLIIKKLLTKEPEDRYQTANSLVHDLDRLQEIDELIARGKDPGLGEKHRVNHSFKTNFVRRKSQEKALQAALNDAREGKPTLTTVLGPAGSGKSRFCEEFIKSNGAENTLVLRASCQPFDQSMPFAAIRNALDAFIEALSLHSFSEQEATESRLKLAAKGIEADLLSLSNGFKKLAVQPAEDAHTSAISEESEKERHFKNIARFFLNLADNWGELFIMIDDAQWLDHSSIKLLKEILDSGAGKKILLLGTAKNDESSKAAIGEIVKTVGETAVRQGTLGSLDAGESYQLICQFLGANDITKPIVDAFQSRSRGLPLAMVELLHTAVEQGALRLKDNKWELDQATLQAISLSDNIINPIIHRLGEISADARRFLSFAALYGAAFDVADIGAVAGIGGDALKKVVADAENLGFLAGAPVPGRMQFSHNRIVEALTGSVGPDEIRAFCDKLANFFFEKKDKSISETLIVAALYKRGNPEQSKEKALAVTMTAADYSLKNFACKEAHGFYTSALEYSKGGDPDLTRRISKNIARCANFLGLWEEAYKHSAYVIEESRTREELFEGLALRTWICSTAGDFTASWEYFREAIRIKGINYPRYFQWKCLSILFWWVASLVLDLIPKSAGKQSAQRESSKSSGDGMTQLFIDAIEATRFLERPWDRAYLVFRFMAMGQLKGDLGVRSIGYAYVCEIYGMLGISKTASRFYCRLAFACAELSKDQFVVHWCKRVCFDTLDYLGDVDLEKLVKVEQANFRNYLDPFSSFKLSLGVVRKLTYRGKCLAALRLLDEMEAEIARLGSSSFSAHWLIAMWHYRWFNLSVVGRQQAAQKVKLAVTAEVNRLRWTYLGSTLLRWETHVRRFNDDFDVLAGEIIQKIHLKQTSSKHPNALFARMSLAYLQQTKLTSTIQDKTSGDSYSLRSEFARCAQFLDGNSDMYPEFHAFSLFLVGRYFAILRRYGIAEYWFRKAENIALKYELAFLIFDIHVERARIAAFSELSMRVREKVTLAYALAAENGWKIKMDALLKEFGSDISTAFAANGSVVTDTNGTGSRGSAAGMARETLIANQTSHRTNMATAHGKVKIEDVRLVDVLLRLSTVFTVTQDPKEQSKLILKEIVKMFAAQRGFVFLHEKTTDTLEIVAAKDVEGEDLQMLKGYSNTVVTKVFKSGTAFVTAGDAKDDIEVSESAVINNLRSIMSAPLKVNDETIGVVYLDSTLAKGVFAKSDLDLFTRMAHQVSISFELSKMAEVERQRMNLEKELQIQVAVASEARKVEILIDNMQQALFAVDSKGVIVDPVSKYTERAFGEKVVGKEVLSVLYKNVAQEKLDSMRSALLTVYGEDDIQWGFMAGNFVQNVQYTSSTEGEAKSFKILPSPIWDSQEKLEKILFSVEDVTQLEKLEAMAKEQRSSAALIEEIISTKAEGLFEFLERSAEQIRNWAKSAQTAAEGENDKTQRLSLLRDLHTIKGNARLFNLRELSSQIHECESALGAGAEEARAEYSVRAVAELEKIESSFSRYRAVLEKVRGMTAQSGSGAVSEDICRTIDDIIGRLEKRTQEPSIVGELRSVVRRIKFKPVRTIVERFAPMVRDVGGQLGKRVDFQIGGEAYVHPDLVEVLQASLLHIIRNSVDHGIESPTERTEAKKAEAALLKVQLSEGPNGVVISISDDGRGIDGERVSKKAVEKGILKPEKAAQMSAKEKTELIFAPGFSTKDEATEISGRGLGLDIVKREVEAKGGTISIRTQVGAGSTFELSLPATVQEMKESA